MNMPVGEYIAIIGAAGKLGQYPYLNLKKHQKNVENEDKFEIVLIDPAIIELVKKSNSKKLLSWMSLNLNLSRSRKRKNAKLNRVSYVNKIELSMGKESVYKSYSEALKILGPASKAIIASPTIYHKTSIEELEKSGTKDILCEKPLARNSDEVKDLIKLKNANIQIGYLLRHSKALQHLCKIIKNIYQNGGKIKYVGSRYCKKIPKTDKRSNAGCIRDEMCHPLDCIVNVILNQVPGYNAKNVKVTHANVKVTNFPGNRGKPAMAYIQGTAHVHPSPNDHEHDDIIDIEIFSSFIHGPDTREIIVNLIQVDHENKNEIEMSYVVDFYQEKLIQVETKYLIKNIMIMNQRNKKHDILIAQYPKNEYIYNEQSVFLHHSGYNHDDQFHVHVATPDQDLLISDLMDDIETIGIK